MNEDTALTTSAVDPDISAALMVYQRLQPLQDALGLSTLTVPEMQLFAMVAHHTGLDPFTKQIYAIKRGGKVMHQTGIDGYRSTAERTSQYRGSDAPEFEACDCGDAGSPAVHPRIARVTVYRAYPDGIRAQVGEARWHELKPEHTKNKSGYGYGDDMWWQMPENQLAKCAEANGLRKAFPRVLGGVYITDEMEQAGPPENAPLVAAAAQPTARERIAARRQALETGLSKAAFVAALKDHGIPASYAADVRQGMFPDGAELTDAQRQTLLDELLTWEPEPVEEGVVVEAESVPMLPLDDEERELIAGGLK